MNGLTPQITARLAALCGVLVGVAILYVISSGPALWWATRDRGWGTPKYVAFKKYYRPLMVLADGTPGCKEPLNWYLSKWDHPRYYVY